MGRLRNAAWRMRDFFRRDAVLAIACVLAAASCMAVPPDAGYAGIYRLAHDWPAVFPYGCHIGPGRAGVLARACRALVRACNSGGACLSRRSWGLRFS